MPNERYCSYTNKEKQSLAPKNSWNLLTVTVPDSWMQTYIVVWVRDR